MAADINASGSSVRPGRAVSVIDPWSYAGGAPGGPSWDVLPDGSFLAPRLSVGGAARRTAFRVSELHVVLNFSEELRRRLTN